MQYNRIYTYIYAKNRVLISRISQNKNSKRAPCSTNTVYNFEVLKFVIPPPLHTFSKRKNTLAAPRAAQGGARFWLESAPGSDFRP